MKQYVPAAGPQPAMCMGQTRKLGHERPISRVRVAADRPAQQGAADGGLPDHRLPHALDRLIGPAAFPLAPHMQVIHGARPGSGLCCCVVLLFPVPLLQATVSLWVLLS